MASRLNKLSARVARRAQKKAAIARIPHCGVIISRKIVENHRYLRDHGLDHSRSIADIHIGTKWSRRLAREMDQQFNADRGLARQPRTRHRLGV